MGLFDRIIARLRNAGQQEGSEDRKKRVVREYIDKCAAYGSLSMADTKLLPHPKREIQEAMLWLIETSNAARNILPPVYLGTAIYQEKTASRDELEILDAVAKEYEELQAMLTARGLA